MDSVNLLNGIEKDANFSFTENTTYGLGGRAEEAYYPKNSVQVKAVYDYCKIANKKLFVLGNGSNVLASDSGFNGVVLCTKHFKGIFKSGKNTVYCRAGTSVAALLRYCASHGYSGLEYLAGIPATCAALAYMNGGIGNIHVDRNITRVKLYDGKLRVFSNKNCNFGNKYSTMRDINVVILGVEFKIEEKTGDYVRENIDAYLKRRAHLPKGKSCGCVFKNPVGDSAGRIIEQAGLKGLSLGGASVSRTHANFIINDNAKAAQVYNLIAAVKDGVYKKTGILLEEEVVYIGDF